MYPRLKLLKDLLSEDGSIFITIDDNEQSNLMKIMEEIFYLDNFLGTIIWEKNYSPRNDAKTFSASHDYIIVYAKNRRIWERKGRNLIPRTEKQTQRYKNPDNDPRGPWQSDNLAVKTYNKAYDYPIKTPNGRIVKPPPGSCWRISSEELEARIKDNRIYFGESGNNVPRIKRFLSEVQEGMVPITLWKREEVGDTQEGKRELLDLLEGNNVFFETPKPTRLIKKVIQLATNKGDLVLDSFAGSGTTAHAILDLNKTLGGNRSFILIEMEDQIANDITAERVKRAIKKLDYKEGFEYCELDKPLFNEEGQIESECTFEQLATYIYFTETNTNLDKKRISGNMIGAYLDTTYYLLFKEKGNNVLKKDFLQKINKIDKKVIYADKCLIDKKTLDEHNIQFKQIPYEVKVY